MKFGKVIAAFAFVAALIAAIPAVAMAADSPSAIPTTNGWHKTTEGEWVYVQDNQQVKSDWAKGTDGKWYYLGEDGVMLTDREITWNDQVYRLNARGAMLTGWQLVGDKWYYYSNYKCTNKWVQTAAGNWYYLGEDGVMQTGFTEDYTGKTYYLNAKGAMLKGWIKDSGKWYYFGNYEYTSEWAKGTDGNWYYLGEDGVMMTNCVVTWNEKDYRLNARGAMLTGWQLVGDKWYYYNNYMYTNQWVKTAAGNWYYLGEDGVMMTNCVVTWNGKDYRLNAKGAWVR